jgi:UDP-glucose 4-epimerase
MKFFITGGAGFIGSHLAERLIADGHSVLVLDDMTTGRMENIDHLIGHDRFTYRIGSVRDSPLVIELVDRCDVAVHLAAAVGVQLIVDRPTYTIETNVHGTEILLDAVARKGKLTVIASTSEVYGKSTRLPFSEADDLVLGNTANPRWSYACSKALDECLALAYHREKGVPVIVARLFNTVGPRQTGVYGMVLPRFAAQAVCDEPITVFGAGDQSRCFAHVGDVVESLLRLMATPEAVGGIFNVGSEEEVTIRRLAEMVVDSAGSRSEIVTLSYEEAYGQSFEDMHRRVPDTTKLRETVGYTPHTPLEQIIADVVEEQRTRHEAALSAPAIHSAV